MWLFLSQAQRIGISGSRSGLHLPFAVAQTLRGTVFTVSVFDPMIFVGAAGFSKRRTVLRLASTTRLSQDPA